MEVPLYEIFIYHCKIKIAKTENLNVTCYLWPKNDNLRIEYIFFFSKLSKSARFVYFYEQL